MSVRNTCVNRVSSFCSPGLFLCSESRDWTVSMMSRSLQFKWTPEREREEGGESSEPVVFMETLKMKQHGGREMRGSDSDSY